MITIENDKSKIVLFNRDDNGFSSISVDNNFKPYFYVPNNDGLFMSIDGKRLDKITCLSPEYVKIKRDEHEEYYEGDIVYVNRYIIDKIISIPKSKIRKMYLDIEIKRTATGYDTPRAANNPILMIGCYDNFRKEYYQYSLKDFNSEKEMISSFILFLNELNPDMIIAWNGDGFDFPFIISRAAKLKIDTNRFARSCPNWQGKCYIPKTGPCKMQGRVLFDLMYAYKKLVSGEGRESWSLDYIGKYEKLGGKEEYKGELDDLYNNDYEKFKQYNKRDIEIMVMLDEKLNIVDFFDEVRRMCYCRFEDVFMNSKIADCLCLRWAKEHNIILPSTKYIDSESFEGAFVKESEPKLHKDIAVMDMKSLYPSIMIGFNTSYETILKEKTDDCINMYDTYFYKKEIGIIPSIVKPLLEKRKEVSKKMKDIDRESREYKTLWMEQYTLKVIANSFYGVLGFKMFRLYNKDVAQSITFAAQKIVKEVHRWFEERGTKVIYGDTDSCFLTMYDNNIDCMKQLNKEINEYFKDYFIQFNIDKKDNIFKLEFEKVFQTVLFKRKADGKGVKKKYAGRIIWKDGKDVDELSITGFESKRSDNAEVGRMMLKEVLRMICYEEEQDKIRKYIDEFKVKIRTEYTPEQIGLPVGISKDLSSYGNQIHARASRLANKKHNAQIQRGDKIKYLYVKGNDNVIAFKSDKYMWDGYIIDYDKMIRRIVDMKVGSIFRSLGWEYKDLLISKHKKDRIKELDEIMKQRELW
jgi:DNA polymerase elongation subunit (family B)